MDLTQIYILWISQNNKIVGSRTARRHLRPGGTVRAVLDLLWGVGHVFDLWQNTVAKLASYRD